MGVTVKGLARRLVEHHGLPPSRAISVVTEVLDGLQQTVEEYIGTRHDELKRAGVANDAIYARIREELPELRFRAPLLSERQIRRRIYG